MNVLDKVYQWVFRLGYPLLCLIWRWFSLPSHIVQVAVWADGKILLVKNSYREQYGLPGGDKYSKETSVYAASRELREETGVIIPQTQLTCVLKLNKKRHGVPKYDEIFECRLENEPDIRIDNREVIHANFCTIEAALSLPLPDIIQAYLRSCFNRETKTGLVNSRHARKFS